MNIKAVLTGKIICVRCHHKKEDGEFIGKNRQLKTCLTCRNYIKSKYKKISSERRKEYNRKYHLKRVLNNALKVLRKK